MNPDIPTEVATPSTASTALSSAQTDSYKSMSNFAEIKTAMTDSKSTGLTDLELFDSKPTDATSGGDKSKETSNDSQNSPKQPDIKDPNGRDGESKPTPKDGDGKPTPKGEADGKEARGKEGETKPTPKEDGDSTPSPKGGAEGKEAEGNDSETKPTPKEDGDGQPTPKGEADGKEAEAKDGENKPTPREGEGKPGPGENDPPKDGDKPMPKGDSKTDMSESGRLEGSSSDMQYGEHNHPFPKPTPREDGGNKPTPRPRQQ